MHNVHVAGIGEASLTHHNLSIPNKVQDLTSSGILPIQRIIIIFYLYMSEEQTPLMILIFTIK